jgi:biotin synthase-related radical SAM superfamily protein
MKILKKFKINEFKVMILVQIFVHTVLTTFGCTVTCKHPWPNFVMARHVAIPGIVDKRVKGEK